MVDLSLVKYHVEKLSAIMSCPTAMMNSDVCRERSIHIMIKQQARMMMRRRRRTQHNSYLPKTSRRRER